MIILVYKILSQIVSMILLLREMSLKMMTNSKQSINLRSIITHALRSQPHTKMAWRSTSGSAMAVPLIRVVRMLSMLLKRSLSW